MGRPQIFIKVSLLLLAGAAGVRCVAPERGDEGLLDTLDRELASGGKYVEERYRRIELLEDMRDRLDVSDTQLFHINIRLYDEYASFQFDGAQQCLVDNLSLAQRLGDDDRAVDAAIRLGMLYTTAGMYLEAREVLTPLDTLAMSQRRMVDYMSSGSIASSANTPNTPTWCGTPF